MLSSGLLFLVVITNFVLATFVLMNNSRAIVNKLLSFLCLTIAGWSVVTYLEDTNINSSTLSVLVRLDFLLASLMIMLFFWFCYSFVHIKVEILKIINFAGAAVCSLLAIFGLIVSVVVHPDQVEFISKPLYPIFIIYLVYGVITGLGLIAFRYRKATGRELTQLQFILLGFFLTSFGIVITNVILPNLVNTPPTVTRLGIYSVLFLTGSMAYAIIRHHLFDIRLVVARAVAYFMLLFVLGSAYILGIISIGGKLFDGETPGGAQQLYNIALILIIAFTLQPLRRFFEKITDSIFYRDHYDTESLLSDLGTIMAREIELEKLTDKFIHQLTEGMKLTKVLVIVLDKGEVFYQANSKAINFRTVSKTELESFGDGIVLKSGIDSDKAPPLAFGKYGVEVSVQLRSKGETVGYVLLGEKQSGDTYNTSDVKLLRILSNELSIAIQNAKSYTQIQSFNKTLQLKVDEATKQLREANDGLKKLDSIKNEFLSMATHQLNTPLTVIDGYLSMAEDKKYGSLAPEQTDFIDKALHRVRTMKRLVLDFLNVSRMETGHFMVEESPVDFNKLVNDEVNGLGPTAKEKEVVLQYFEPKHPVPILEVDESKIRQAVMNLIDNAIYYAPKGEVKVYLDSDDQNIMFKVVDNGIGVPENQKANLFQKFMRADNAKKERPSGTGVGLYLVRRVIEAQGGSLIFDSAEGKGSTFGFKLPIKEPSTEKVEVPKPAEPVATKQDKAEEKVEPKIEKHKSAPAQAKQEEPKKEQETKPPAKEDKKEPVAAQAPKEETSYYKIYG